MLRARLLLFLLLPLCGCGTIASQALKDGFIIESPTPPWELVYGGTKVDIEEIGFSLSNFPGQTLKIPFLIADLPLSFCADTLLLPFTLTAAIRHDRKAEADKRVLEGRHSSRDN